MTRKYKNFWYCLTPRQYLKDSSLDSRTRKEKLIYPHSPDMEGREITADVLLEIDDHEPDKHPEGAPHMHDHPYPDSAAAIAAAEDWIESAHRTVLDYYRGGHKG